MKKKKYYMLSDKANDEVFSYLLKFKKSVESGILKTRSSAIKRIQERIIRLGKKHPNIYKRITFLEITHNVDNIFNLRDWEPYHNCSNFEFKIWTLIADDILNYETELLNDNQINTIYSYFTSIYRQLTPYYFETTIHKVYPFDPKNRDKYPSNWNSIVKSVLERAKNKCEKCKAVNGKPHRNSRSIVKLEIAHLDHNPLNNNLKNLRAYCKSCHTTHDVPLRHYRWEQTMKQWWTKEGKKRTKYTYDKLKKLDLHFI